MRVQGGFSPKYIHSTTNSENKSKTLSQKAEGALIPEVGTRNLLKLQHLCLNTAGRNV